MHQYDEVVQPISGDVGHGRERVERFGPRQPRYAIHGEDCQVLPSQRLDQFLILCRIQERVERALQNKTVLNNK